LINQFPYEEKYKGYVERIVRKRQHDLDSDLFRRKLFKVHNPDSMDKKNNDAAEQEHNLQKLNGRLIKTIDQNVWDTLSGKNYEQEFSIFPDDNINKILRRIDTHYNQNPKKKI